MNTATPIDLIIVIIIRSEFITISANQTLFRNDYKINSIENVEFPRYKTYVHYEQNKYELRNI